MNIDRLRQLKQELHSEPDNPWYLINRKELSDLILKLELIESILRGENGWNGRRSTD